MLMKKIERAIRSYEKRLQRLEREAVAIHEERTALTIATAALERELRDMMQEATRHA